MIQKKFDKTKIYLFFSLIIVLGLYFALAFKSPFSVRTLIPNLEPYPDSFYYAVPAWNLIQKHGFNMSYFAYSVKQIFPPLYSFLLIPFFAIFRDVRSFYFANLFLMFGSIFFLMLIFKKLFGNKIYDLLIVTFLLFLFVSNFYIYTLPTYLLAENVTTFLVIFSLYLLLSEVTKTKSLFSGCVGVLFWLIKFSNFPLGISFYFLYLLKILKDKNRKYFIYFLSSMIIIGIGFFIYIFKSGIFIGHKNLQQGTSFSIKYFQNNLNFYLENLLGHKGQFLWFSEKMLSPIISLLAVFGIVVGFFSKKTRSLLFYILTFIFLLIGFMCFFYTNDTRYIISIYPLLIVLVAVFFHFLVKKFHPIILLFFIIIVLSCLILVRGFNQKTDERMILTFKKQVGLNFKYKEDPWYYIAVQDFNNFFSNNVKSKAYLGTYLPPFFINFYTNKHYSYLPLSLGQDFFPGKDGLAEEMKINSIYEYYNQLLLKGNNIYITNIFSNNSTQWQKGFQELLKQFNYKLVKTGCLETCNLYEITFKKY